jgi:hypothetical protein
MRAPPRPPDGRTAERRIVGIRAHLREFGGDRLDVDVEDLSTTGFRIDSVYGIAVGARVYLTIPSFAPLEAFVAWRQKSGYGCQFVRPLHPAVFELIAARHAGG